MYRSVVVVVSGCVERMFYKSYAKCEARAFDHLYDPIYTAGNMRDIQRENAIALTKTAPINIYTNFNSMFSELPQRPRTFAVLQRNQLPKTPEIAGKHFWKKCLIFFIFPYFEVSSYVRILNSLL